MELVRLMAGLYFQFRGIGPTKALFARAYAPSQSEAQRIVMEEMHMRARLGRATCPIEIEERVGNIAFHEGSEYRVYFDKNGEPMGIGAVFSVTLYQRRVLAAALNWEAKYGTMPFRACDLGITRPEKALDYLVSQGVLFPIWDGDGKWVRYIFIL